MPILPRKRQLRITKAKKDQVENWKEGASLELDSGKTIPQLALVAGADRWKLAVEHRRHANKLLAASPPLYRNAVSRYYYAMYHAIRACSYVSHGGDDHQEHRQLQRAIPKDFAPAEDWQTKLKNARLLRNQADYDPYPKSDNAFKADALSLKVDTDRLILLARQYLRDKGCTI